MKDTSKHSLWIASAAMEITWLCAWSAFTLDAISQRPYPVEQISGGFLLAALIARLCTRLELRALYTVALHALGLALLSAWGVWSLWFQHEPFWSVRWLRASLTQSRAASDYLLLSLSGVWTVVTWLNGTQYAARSRAYLAVCQRFDVGLTWLFALLLLKLLLTVGAGLHFTEHVSEGLIVPFFCFGVLALAVARNTSGQQKRFMSGYRGIGLVGGFVALVALLGTGAALLFTPYLQALSVAGYSELKHADPTFLRLLAGLYMLILSWWLKDHKPEHPRITPRNEDKGAGSPIPGGRPHLRLEETESLAFWLVIGTVAALVTGAIVWGIWKVHAQTPARARGPHWWEWLRAWLAHLFRQTQLLVQRILPGAQRDPVQLYLALLRWGRRSGIPHRPDETALEYAERLQARVRPMHAEIALIVATFNQHAYAQSACDGKTLSETQRALRRLHSPRLWPTRVSLWFAGEESLST